MTFAEFTEVMAAGGLGLPGKEDTIHHLINEQSRANDDVITSLDAAYEIELGGGIQGFSKAIAAALALMSANMTGQSTARTPVSAWNTQLVSALLFEALRKTPDNSMVPSLQIYARLHACIRRQRQASHRGDFFDHRHACVALPYFDCFFTERTLRNLICHPELALDQTFSCPVFHRDQDVLAYLQTLE